MQTASRLSQPACAIAILSMFALPVPAQEAGSCEEEAHTPQTALLDVTVLDDQTGVPLQAVDIVMNWVPEGKTKSEQRKAATDRRGVVRFCDAPAAVLVTLRVDGGSRVSGTRSVHLAEGDTGSVQLVTSSLYSVVSGRIIDHATGRPVGAATIDLGFDQLRSMTRDDGEFEFERVPPGFYDVNVQHIGYANVRDSIGVDYAARVTVTARLAPAAIPIEPLEVVVRSQGLERRGFYNRMERGIGTFLTRKDVQDMHALRGSDILRRITGIQLVQHSTLGAIAVGRGNCPFRYVIDGARLAAIYSMDDMSPHWIDGIEIYKGPSQIPIEFTGISSDPNAACGVIVIWTRNR
ncbi:MAG: carboxypeptidase regulatory-like domain-containing protein [Longimicrobiales bacterium]